MKARKQVADATFETQELSKEQQIVHSAIETAEALLRQEQLDAERAEHHEREVEARQHADGLSALNLELDEMLITLRQAFERRAALLKGLSNIGIVDPNLLMKLSHRSGPTSAAHLAGLNRFLHLEHTPTVAQRCLAEVNELLANIGAAPKSKKGNSDGRH